MPFGGSWTVVGSIPVEPGTTNVAFELQKDSLPTNGVVDSCFFSMGTQDDTDGDGLTDAYERTVSLTDPYCADTDGDGLPDADEDWLYGTDPFFADSDWDGSPDSEEIANGTDPLNRLSHYATITLTLTNICASADVTNFFGFSRTSAGWDVTNALAATYWGLASNVVATTEGLFGKAFSDLNRNGVYDEDADVIMTVSLESEHAIMNAIITLGDIDGDGVSDATERNDGTDPYDENNFLLHATVKITDSDAGHSITNYVVYSTSLSNVVLVASNALGTDRSIDSNILKYSSEIQHLMDSTAPGCSLNFFDWSGYVKSQGGE